VALYPIELDRRQQPWHRHVKKQSCVYCQGPGGHPDHVPPSSVFYGKPDDLITVPCCKDCTNKASGLDAHFKFVVASRVSTKGNQLRHDWMLRAAKGAARDGKLSRYLAKTLTRTSAGGMGQMPTDSLNAVGGRIVRGLFWYEYGERFPSNRPVTSWQIPSVDYVEPAISDHLVRREVAGGQFRYAFLRTVEDPWFSVWVLQFHGTTTLIAETNIDRHRNRLFEETALGRPE
jgi:hypothetical protein